MSISEVDANRIQDWLAQDNNRRQFVPVSTTANQENDAISSAVMALVQKIAEVVEPFAQPAFIRIACQYRRADIVIRSGWLPHNTTPWDIVGVDMTPEQCSDALADFYGSTWAHVHASLVASVGKKNLDDEARAVFLEALAAHEYKLYRAVPRLLFPEIERVTREHHFSGIKKTDVEKTLQRHLEKMAVTELHAHGGYDVYSMSKLSSHLYHQMWDNKPYPEAQTDFVPNRHAAIHGFVVYNSAKSSFNMLAMCELIFAIISALNARGQNIN